MNDSVIIFDQLPQPLKRNSPKKNGFWWGKTPPHTWGKTPPVGISPHRYISSLRKKN